MLLVFINECHLFVFSKDEKNQIMTSNVWLKQVWNRNLKENYRNTTMSRNGMMINFDGIRVNTEGSMFSTFQVNKFGYPILFYTISKQLDVVNRALI